MAWPSALELIEAIELAFGYYDKCFQVSCFLQNADDVLQAATGIVPILFLRLDNQPI